uniref:Uncharacterized protein n=1 Tax=Oryza rufipogon TaxID=4529 RepID=A0A0E0R6Y2_ORYRU
MAAISSPLPCGDDTSELSAESKCAMDSAAAGTIITICSAATAHGGIIVIVAFAATAGSNAPAPVPMKHNSNSPQLFDATHSQTAGMSYYLKLKEALKTGTKLRSKMTDNDDEERRRRLKKLTNTVPQQWCFES